MRAERSGRQLRLFDGTWTLQTKHSFLPSGLATELKPARSPQQSHFSPRTRTSRSTPPICHPTSIYILIFWWEKHVKVGVESFSPLKLPLGEDKYAVGPINVDTTQRCARPAVAFRKAAFWLQLRLRSYKNLQKNRTQGSGGCHAVSCHVVTLNPLSSPRCLGVIRGLWAAKNTVWLFCYSAVFELWLTHMSCSSIGRDMRKSQNC